MTLYRVVDILENVVPTFTSIIFIYIAYASYVYAVWDRYFGGKRVGRGAKSNPSNCNPPDIKTYELNRKHILEAAENYPENYATCKLLYALMKTELLNKRKHFSKIPVQKKQNEAKF